MTDIASIITNQKWLPNDSATVTTAGGTAVSGTVTFSLYENGDCSGTAFATFTDSSAPYETNNTTVYTSNKAISWSASFAADRQRSSAIGQLVRGQYRHDQQQSSVARPKTPIS